MAFLKVALVFLACLLQASEASLKLKLKPKLAGKLLPREVTLDSAYTMHGNLVLFAQYELMTVSQISRKGISRIPWKGRVFNLTDIPIVQAAYGSFDSKRIFFYGANNSSRVTVFNERTYQFFDYNSRKRRFLANGGPDAAAKRGNKRYFFKGCRYAIKRSVNRWSRPKNLKKLGLPCHIDAAWRNGTDTLLVRGDKLWYWREDNSVDKPVDFNSVFNIEDMWIVKPYTGPED